MVITAQSKKCHQHALIPEHQWYNAGRTE